MLNNWCGQGRLAKDVELRYTASQTPVASFSIACDRDFAARDGSRETDWIDVVAWNKSAEFVSKYFHKGDMIIVSGRLQVRNYEDKNGSKRKVTEVVATAFNFCGSKNGGDRGGNQYAANSSGGGYQGNSGYSQYNGAEQYSSGDQYGSGNTQYGNSYQQGDLNGFMSIPDGIDEELPFN